MHSLFLTDTAWLATQNFDRTEGISTRLRVRKAGTRRYIRVCRDGFTANLRASAGSRWDSASS
jgi:hypothetical protein